MVYVLTYSMIMPGTPNGYIGDLFENAYSDMSKAERAFNSMMLNKEYFRKELWVIESNGLRKLMKEKRFDG